LGLSFRHRVWTLVSFVVAGFLLMLLAIEPVSQDPAYHAFADSRAFFGIPNFGDVVSNAGFALVASIAGITLWGAGARRYFVQPADARPYAVFFVGVALVSLGSAWYHLAPDNHRLLWDRLPMSMAFMAFTAAVISDRIHSGAGNTWGLALLLLAGIASLAYWAWTESMGRGDLRFYGFVQFFPVIALPLILWLFPKHRYTAGRYLGWLVAWFVLSKLFEHFDRAVFDALGHTVSGHTLKHLAAAVAALVVLRMLLTRTENPAEAVASDDPRTRLPGPGEREATAGVRGPRAQATGNRRRISASRPVRLAPGDAGRAAALRRPARRAGFPGRPPPADGSKNTHAP
jgi:hypothetical protein